MNNIRPILVLFATFALAACASGPFGNMSGKNGPSQPQKPPTGNNNPSAQHPKEGGQNQNREWHVDETPVPTVPQQKAPPRTAAEISSPAVMSLLKQSRAQAKAGQPGASAATLERAIGLAPRNPFIYQRLAAVRATQGNYGQAEQLAMKSNSLANGNPYVQATNWKLIAAARHASGDDRGAQQASARAVNYQRAASQYQ